MMEHNIGKLIETRAGQLSLDKESAKKFALITPPFCCNSLNMSYEIRVILQ